MSNPAGFDPTFGDVPSPSAEQWLEIETGAPMPVLAPLAEQWFSEAALRVPLAVAPTPASTPATSPLVAPLAPLIVPPAPPITPPECKKTPTSPDILIWEHPDLIGQQLAEIMEQATHICDKLNAFRKMSAQLAVDCTPQISAMSHILNSVESELNAMRLSIIRQHQALAVSIER